MTQIEDENTYEDMLDEQVLPDDVSEEYVEIIDENAEMDVLMSDEEEFIVQLDESEADENVELHVIPNQETEEEDVVVKSSIDDLPIHVTFHIGTCTMTCKQIESLQANDLISVRPHYQDKVSVRVNDSEIGVGQVVSVNGEAAVQVTRLWSK